MSATKVIGALARAFRTDAGSAQELLPGVSPLTARQMQGHARNALAAARENATFVKDSPLGPVRYEYLRPGQYNVNNDDVPHTTIPNYTLLLDGRGTTSLDLNRGGGALAETQALTADEIASRFGIRGALAKARERDAAVQAAQGRLDALRRPVLAEEAQDSEGVIAGLRAQRSPAAPAEEAYGLERRIAAAKRQQPVIGELDDYMDTGFGNYMGEASGGRGIVGEHPDVDQPVLRAHRDRQQRQAHLVGVAREYADMVAAETARGPVLVEQPQWAVDLGSAPMDINNGYPRPEGLSWWRKALNLPPAVEPYTGDLNVMDPRVVEAFYEGARDVPEAFTYGTRADHRGARDLAEMADSFARTSGRRVHMAGGELTEAPLLKYSRGDYLKDEHGNYKGQDRVHSAGDYPMYDESGNVKKVEISGPTEDGEPLLVKRRAEEGDIWRDSYGDTEFEYEEARGGELRRDRYGDYVRDEDAEDGIGDIELSVPGEGRITVSNYGQGDEAGVYAMHGGKAGELLYQTLLSDATQRGNQIGGRGLTEINRLRMLANTNSNYARWGDNPRDVGGTVSHSMTPEIWHPLRADGGYASGPDIWRAEASEVKSRLGPDAGHVTFDGKSFFIDREEATPAQISEQIARLSPGLIKADKGASSGIGQKSLMRTAVFDWLRTATPEEALEVGKNWNKIGAPLFGKASPEILATIAAVAGVGGGLHRVLQDKVQGGK